MTGHLGRLAPVLGLLVVVLSACTGDRTYDPAEDRSDYTTKRQLSDFDTTYPGDFSAKIDLPDGRKVAMFYDNKRGLAEQHYSPEADAWTEPKLIYETDTDPCQGITLKEQGGTVAVIADWNIYCYDGEPPDESIAGVATGDLTEWETDLTRHFDGWQELDLSDGGATVTWTHQDDRVTWERGEGFE